MTRVISGAWPELSRVRDQHGPNYLEYLTHITRDISEFVLSWLIKYNSNKIIKFIMTKLTKLYSD